MTDALDEMAERIRVLHHEDAQGFCDECGTEPWPCRTILAMVGEWDFTIPLHATTDVAMAAVFREQFRQHGVRAGDRIHLRREP